MTALPPAELPLSAPVTALRGVGGERATQLERLGLRTLEDLLLHRPRRYEDRRQLLPIAGIREKVAVAVRGRIVALGVKRFRNRKRSVFELILDDGTARLHCRWWNMAFLEEYFAVGEEWMVYGRVVELKPRTMDHPETEKVETEDEPSFHMDRIVPIYPLTDGLPQRWLRSRIGRLVELKVGEIAEPRPEIDRGELPARSEAIRALHFPMDLEEAEQARRRLAFDEFLDLQLALQTRRLRLFSRVRGLPCGGDNRWMRPFLARLGFQLTEGQTRVLREIRRDMSSGHPMRRMVQGDVGSGKTVVAAAAALMAMESGFDAALMAPTEILAEQHWRRFSEWFHPLGLEVAIRTGATKGTFPGAESGQALPGLSGPRLTIGTHALLSSGFEGRKLGLVIIDEQHKFGVTQREQLVRKGLYPHLLVTTATPIPRTLALTLYGDLDVSEIRERPEGRGRLRTFIRGQDKMNKVWSFIREQVAAGRQAYIVYPRVEDDGSAGVRAVTREFTEVTRVLAPHTVGLIHGRLASDEKERVMKGFREGRLQVLLATLVIEVGMDVPNATVMVIEGAEHFGLAQLHQLRGRIGRGQHESVCILVPTRDDPEVLERLQVLVESTDGFAIAEADLRLRGPGELLGEEQSGAPPLRFGDLALDRELLERARTTAAEWLKTHPPGDQN